MPETPTPTTIHLYCELTESGQVSGHGAHAPAHDIIGHVVEVPQGALANELLNRHAVYDTDFGGRYTVPRHAYRRATQAEIATYQAVTAPVSPEADTTKATKGK